MNDRSFVLINIMIDGCIDHNFFARNVPRVGTRIRTSKIKDYMKVVDIVYDYSQVSEFGADDERSGNEVVFVFVKPFP